MIAWPFDKVVDKLKRLGLGSDRGFNGLHGMKLWETCKHIWKT